jgi:transcriptional regulator with PAS, ATPase and Fis domain
MDIGHVQKVRNVMEDENAKLKLVLSSIDPYPFNAVIGNALGFCLRNPCESIIVVDRKGLVQFMDPSTERFFGLRPGGARGMRFTELAPTSDFPAAMATGIPVIGRVKEIAGAKKLCSVYPLSKGGKIIGAVATVFHSFEGIEAANSTMGDREKKRRGESNSVYAFDNILGASKPMRDTVDLAKRISRLNTDVLLVGESGTGKELFAHSIHGYTHADRPFIKVNCAAIPSELAESQLFGYEKGAFTGSHPSGRAGVFEAASNGVVFLDEISSLPLSVQAKLLRVLQEREIQRIGSNKTIKVSFTFIAATNVDLRKLVEEGRFRPDLYYRVARPALRIPPLRKRREDIALYLQSFLKIVNESFKTAIRGFSGEAMDILVAYDWPGNVRELIHVLEQIAIEAWDVEEIEVKHLPGEIRSRGRRSHECGSNAFLLDKPTQCSRDKERDSITAALRETKGNKRKAAMLLGMPRSTFYHKITRYCIKGLRAPGDLPEYE